METWRADQGARKSIDRFGARDFSSPTMGGGPGADLQVSHAAPGVAGCVGEHPAAGDQLLVVVKGRAHGDQGR